MIKKFIPAIKKHLDFSKKEYTDIILATLILSFIFSLSKWNGKASYPLHLISIIIIVFISFLLHLTVQKIFGIKEGYEAEFKVSIISLLSALMLGILTYVPINDILLVLVIPGTMTYKIMSKHRIGKWPRGPNFGELGFITSAGIVSNLLLAIIFYGLYLATNMWAFWLITIINVFFAFGTVLPIPKNDGLIIFFSSRVVYIIIATLTITTSYLIFMEMSFLASLSLIIILVFTVWSSYYFAVEKKIK